MRYFEFSKNILLEYDRLGILNKNNKSLRNNIVNRYYQNTYPHNTVPDNILNDPNSADKIIDKVMSTIESVKIPNVPDNYYAEWFAVNYAKGYLTNMSDFTEMIRFLEAFHQYKDKSWFPKDSKNIFMFTPDSLSEFINNLVIPEKPVISKGKSQVIIDNENYRLILLLDKDAAIYYGRGTNPRWCTSYTTSENLFDDYNDNGELYVLLPKKPKHVNEKYQIYFRTGMTVGPANEIANESNKKLPESLFIKQINDPDITKFMLEMDPRIRRFALLQPENIDKVWKLISMWYRPKFEEFEEEHPEYKEYLINFWKMISDLDAEEMITDFITRGDKEDINITFIGEIWSQYARYLVRQDPKANKDIVEIVLDIFNEDHKPIIIDKNNVDEWEKRYLQPNSKIRFRKRFELDNFMIGNIR